MCDNYCSAYGYQDADLIQRFFSSYSGAERRIYHKVEEGEILADTSRSLLKIMEETEESMFNKEMEKKRKEEKKKKEEDEKQQRKLERARVAEEKKKQAEEKKRQREEQKARKVEEKKIKGGKKSRKVETVNNIPELRKQVEKYLEETNWKQWV